MSKSKNKSLAVVPTDTRLAVISAFTPQERKVFDDLSELDRQHAANTLLYWREFGLRAKGAFEAIKAGKTGYGSNFIDRLAASLGKTRAVVDAAIRVAQLYPVKTEFLKLIHRGDETFEISWTHMQHLSAVTSDSKRNKLIDMVYENQWTAAELAAYMSGTEFRKTPNNPRGKLPAPPRSVADCLANVRETAKKYTNLVENAWLSKTFNLVKEFERTPPAYSTEELAEDVEDTLDALAKQRQLLTKLEEAVASVRDKLHTRLSLQRPGDVIDGVATPAPGTCLKGGEHDPVKDDADGVTYCSKCHEALDGPNAAPAKPKKKK